MNKEKIADFQHKQIDQLFEIHISVRKSFLKLMRKNKIFFLF